MNSKLKKLITNAITQPKSFNFWGHTLISQYIRELKAKDSQIPIAYNKSIYEQNIIRWVENNDSNLDIFLRYNKVFEGDRNKTTTLLKLSESKDKFLSGLIKNFAPLDYDPVGMGNWQNPKLIFAAQNDTEFEFWFSIKAEKLYPERIEIASLPSKTVTVIEEYIKGTNPNFESLEELVASYAVHSRIINIVKVNKVSGNLSFSTDQPKLVDPDLDEKTIISPENRLNNFVQQSLELLNVKSPEAVHDEIKNNLRISRGSVSKIKALSDGNSIIIPYKHEQKYQGGEVTEKNSNTFENYTIQMIRKSVKSFYEENSTFEGFFLANPQLDAERSGHIIKVLTNDQEIERTATGFFFCIVNRNGHVEISKVFVNSALGSLRVAPEKGGLENARFYEELDRIFSE
ncbi:hypothetical protein LFX25_19965 [Leptospira sp. FAT2]|uniref:hypothetical protein n=1 Tax=Leptospira sanjuanensis TaxID=2879643 RepID=UPI001EE94427|nr:hypothetical protein [Leptospira sanjuanensis]MCG6195521.1 hypothetical protein [Leptospira sanjuanensis]